MRMPISRDDRGFLFWPDAWGTPSLGLETATLQASVAEVRFRKLTGIFGRQPEFHQTDLACLGDLPDLTSVELWDISLTDVTAIYGLPGLTHFRISGKRPPIDFARLPSLEKLVLEHHRKDKGAFELPHLRMLHLWRLKGGISQLSEIWLPDTLQDLGLYFSDVETLDGLQACPNVTRLDIARCRKLQSLGNIAVTFPALEHLTIQACGRLTADEARRALIGHRQVRHAFAGGKLVISA
jgi:hypothetical protein